MDSFKKIIIIISIACIVIGGIVATIGFSSGGYFSLSIFGNRFKSTDGEEHIALQAFEEFDLQVSYGDIRVVEGNEYSLKIKNIPEEYYTIEENNGKFSFEFKKKFSQYFDFSKIGVDYEITLTLPKGVALKRGYIKSNMGDVKVSDVTTNHLFIDQQMGDIDVYNTYVNGDLDLDQSMGDIKFSGYARGESTIANSMGDINIEIYDREEDYVYVASTSMGDVSINDVKEGDGINAKAKGGSKSAPYRMDVSNRMGNIELEFEHVNGN